MTEKPPPHDQRLMSLDALRGFVMLWIVGGAEMVRQAAAASGWRWADRLAVQMRHAAWEGVRFYDLIFPLFVFISGVAVAYAVGARMERGLPRRGMWRGIVRRVILLILLGVVYNGPLSLDPARMRFASVLGLIGAAYGIAAAVTLAARRAVTPLVWAVGIMGVVAAVQLLVPVPGYGPGVLTPQGAINGYIDRLLLPGRLFGGVFDPEGLLCTVSAAALALLGVCSGRVLRSQRLGSHAKAFTLAGAGALLLAAGLLAAPLYPPIKALWTSTFILIAGGVAMGLTALFYLVIDGWRLQRWSFFLRVVGLNSITIYMAARLVDFRFTADFLFTGLAGSLGPWQPVLVTAAVLGLEWLMLWVLYRKGIFLKV